MTHGDLPFTYGPVRMSTISDQRIRIAGRFWFVMLMSLLPGLTSAQGLAPRGAAGGAVPSMPARSLLSAEPMKSSAAPVRLPESSAPAAPGDVESRLKVLEQTDPVRAAEIRMALGQGKAGMQGAQEVQKQGVRPEQGEKPTEKSKDGKEKEKADAKKQRAKETGEELPKKEEERATEEAKVAGKSPSAIESLFSQGALAEESFSVGQFGYDLFQQGGGFTPPSGALVGPDYVLGPGDEFSVAVWGLVEGSYSVHVSREGMVVFPKVGPVPVAGVPYGELKGHLEKAFSKHYKNFQLSVTMGQLRGIQVFIVGEVQKPGSYSLDSLATMFAALFASGGPTKSGSLRDIRLLRNGKVVKRLDLYDFLLKGDKSQDVRLQEQDTVFVPLIGPVVAVSGHVYRPAIYEIKGTFTLGDLLDLAGGVRPTGYLHRVQVERIVAHQKKIVLDVDLLASGAGGTQQPFNGDALRAPVQNMDQIRLFPINPLLQDVVYLRGHAARPGLYQFTPGMRVTDVVKSVRDLLPDAYLEYAQIVRITHESLSVSVPGNASIREVIPVDLRKALHGEESANIRLQSLDEIIVISRDELKMLPTVTILGEVRKPGTYPLLNRMRVSDLVLLGGGLNSNASFGGAELTRYAVHDGKTHVLIMSLDLGKTLSGDAEHNPEIHEFDVLVVRPIPESEGGQAVTITGEVKRPGVYTIKRGERLSFVLKRAGGFTSRAFPKGAIFVRESVKKTEQEQMQKLSALHAQRVSSESSALSIGGLEKPQAEAQKEVLATQQGFPQRLQSQVTLGRMIVWLDEPEKLEGTADDLVLEDGDSLEVPLVPDTVSVLGSVRNPTAVHYGGHFQASDYVRFAGGLTPDADWEGAYLVKADGSAVTLYESVGFSNHGPAFHPKQGSNYDDRTQIERGDTIVVPLKVEVKTRQAPVWQAVPDPSQTGVTNK